MKLKKIILIFSLLLSVLTQVTLASESDLRFSLRQCVDSAMLNNPVFAAAGLTVEKAELMRNTAFDPPFTSITLKQETTGGGGPENGVSFNQEFDFPSTYVARRKALNARADLERSRLAVVAAEMETEVTRNYYSLVYYGELLRLHDELEEVYDTFCNIASVRLKEGAGSALELMNAERVREKNRLERLNVQTQYEAGVAQLQRLTGIRSEITPADTLLLPLPYEGAEFDFSNTPRGVAASKEVEVADREMVVAKNELLPGLHVGATVQALIKGFNPYHVERLPFEKGNFMGFEIGISVPLFFGAPTARMKAADMESRISRLNRDAAENEAAGEIDKLNVGLSTLLARLAYYKETAIPRAENIKRLARVSYLYGEIDYLEYIANMETVYDLMKEYAACINEFNQTVINLKNIISCQ